MLTINEIKQILRQERIAINKRLGQNFLVDAAYKSKIVQALRICPTDQILEIGPGLGALTEDLIKLSAGVIAVEKDRGLARVLQKNLSGSEHLQIICADILKADIAGLIKQKLKVVGNLPYYITTPIIGYLLEQQLHNLDSVFMTVQNEVGKRLVAQPNSKDYAAITILVQYFTKPEILFSIPKKAFYPQPRVDSVFMCLHVLPVPAVKVNEQAQFFKIVRATFNQRRKTILNSLAHRLGRENKDQLQQVLKQGGIDAGMRPEQLSIEQFAGIEDVLNRGGIKFE